METPARILTRGFLGVDFFFVLSGFLITTLLLREEDRTGFISLSGFYIRRSLRILPVYFLVITLIALYYIGLKSETQYLEHLPFYYLFLSNFLTSHIPTLGPTWSLSVEEQYYLLWPLLLLAAPRRWLPVAIGVLVALNLAAVLPGIDIPGIAPVAAGPLLFDMFTATYAPILLGSGLALLLHDGRSFAALAAVLGHRRAAPVCGLALLVLIAILPQDITGWPNLAIHLTMASCLATIVLREDHGLAPLLTLRPFAFVGRVSYCLYLYHLIGLHIATILLAKLGTDSPWAILILYAPLSVAIAAASFRFYETPFLALRHGKAARRA